MISLASTQNLKLTVFKAKKLNSLKAQNRRLLIYLAFHDELSAEFRVMQFNLLLY